MKRSLTLALTASLLLAGCAGTRTPKLARCTGPYRYANPYGTVLPALPIPGQPAQAALPPPAPTPSAGHPEPGKTSGLVPAYPSC